jgi:predicted transcriptional regulator
MTIKDKIRSELSAYKGRELTASMLSENLNVNLSTVSSKLSQMVAAGDLLRYKGRGVRGGYGYVLKY